jgi:hypothetical protein
MSMNILKNLFGGSRDRDERGSYFYVRPQRCDDVLRVRVDLYNDLSLTDDGSGYWVRKLASSSNYKCQQVELTLYFNKNHRLENSEVVGGSLVERSDYDAWQESQAQGE